MRRRIYGHGDAGHVEVALNLCKLGETDRARGELPAAAAHFAEACEHGLGIRTAIETGPLKLERRPERIAHRRSHEGTDRTLHTDHGSPSL